MVGDLMSICQEELAVRFLRVLERKRASLKDDKQFAKIIQKMERGKNLKRKEFAKVYFLLREWVPLDRKRDMSWAKVRRSVYL